MGRGRESDWAGDPFQLDDESNGLYSEMPKPKFLERSDTVYRYRHKVFSRAEMSPQAKIQLLSPECRKIQRFSNFHLFQGSVSATK